MPEWFAWFGRGMFGVQVPILIMLLTYLVAWVLLSTPARPLHLRHRRQRRSRAAVRRARIALQVAGVFDQRLTAAIAGLVLSSRLMSGQPNAGVGFELDAIAAVVLGGARCRRPWGDIGTLVGALLLGVLNNGLNMLGVSPYVQSVIKGGIILLAIFISRNSSKRS